MFLCDVGNILFINPPKFHNLAKHVILNRQLEDCCSISDASLLIIFRPIFLVQFSLSCRKIMKGFVAVTFRHDASRVAIKGFLTVSSPRWLRQVLRHLSPNPPSISFRQKTGSRSFAEKFLRRLLISVGASKCWLIECGSEGTVYYFVMNGCKW